ncbi:hypothetical protein IB232_04145 [Pseudomonas sp. PDM15]|uniref:hypothetical protein n=1 Tax=Pseudomonas sp. PDM15 TaxID=2769303 RepID=UPI00177E8057|nr:hypothetical protein [Pseudomonas sp. PDM15]MBD9424504.1 hypothetical protein [Pseudomonas sp. PDM15]
MPAKKNFHTYSEAQAAAQALGIKISSELKKHIREVAWLPPSPNQAHADAGWIDGYNLLANVRPDLYPTYAAQVAVQALGISSLICTQPTAKQMRQDLHDLGCRMRLRQAEADCLVIKD